MQEVDSGDGLIWSGSTLSESDVQYLWRSHFSVKQEGERQRSRKRKERKIPLELFF